MARQRFESVEVTEDGRSRPLVDGTRIVITVDDGPDGQCVSAGAGCNGMSVQGGIQDGRLTGRVVMTLKSCGPDRGSGPRSERDGDRLRLTAGGTTIVLAAVPQDT